MYSSNLKVEKQGISGKSTKERTEFLHFHVRLRDLKFVVAQITNFFLKNIDFAKIRKHTPPNPPTTMMPHGGGGGMDDLLCGPIEPAVIAVAGKQLKCSHLHTRSSCARRPSPSPPPPPRGGMGRRTTENHRLVCKTAARWPQIAKHFYFYPYTYVELRPCHSYYRINK